MDRREFAELFYAEGYGDWGIFYVLVEEAEVDGRDHEVFDPHVGDVACLRVVDWHGFLRVFPEERDDRDFLAFWKGYGVYEPEERLGREGADKVRGFL